MWHHSYTCRRVIFAVVVLCTSTATLFAAPPQKDKKAFPKFNIFEEAAQDYFDKLRNYREGDIISQRDVRAILRILKQHGWIVLEQDELLGLVLPDSDYMVVQLRTKKGRVFMHQLSKTPEAYDRLERFLKLPKSKRYFQGLLDGPDGYKMFQYMVTSKGGKEMGIQLSRTKDGRNFNKPTGHLYTAEELMKKLSEYHAAYVLFLNAEAANPQPAGN